MKSWRLKSFCACLVLLAFVLLTVSPAAAVTNRAVGGIGGLNNDTLRGGDGTGSAQFTLNVVDLALVKQARSLDGVVLSGGADVDAGQELCFVLYVANPSPVVGSEIEIVDNLDADAFTYLWNSLEQAIVPHDATDEDLWVAEWTPLTDLVSASGDIASVRNPGGDSPRLQITIGTTDEVANQPATVPAGSILAVRFRVRVN